MSEVISVRFRSGSKAYDFDPCGLRICTGEEVVVETAQGLEFAVCSRGNHEIPESALVKPLSPVLRLATDADRRTMEHHRRREEEAYAVGERKIAQHGLEMKLVGISASFDGNKLVFYFTADGRVDFRALVRDLASSLHCRIELRQIGVRDEAKMIGGIGICGRPFCCSEFLTSFMPVSIKMAKTQNLSLNPTKISGACGRLMCCLKYEQYAYEDAARRLPKLESFVQTPDGPGNVKAVDLLRETVRVALDPDPEHPRTYTQSEIILLRNGKGSRDGIAIPERPARHVEEKREETPLPPFASYDDGAIREKSRGTSLFDKNRVSMSADKNRVSAEKSRAFTPADKNGEEFALEMEYETDGRRYRDNRRGVKGTKSGDGRKSASSPKQKKEFFDGDPKRRRQKSWFRNNRGKGAP